MQHSAEQRNVSRHFLFLGNVFRFLALLVLLLRSLHIIRQQTRADAFKKMAFPPWASGHADVKGTLLSAFQSRDDFLRRSEEAQAARQIIRRAQRENAQGNTAI